MRIDKGKLQGWKHDKRPKQKSADRYVDSSGKKRYKGTAHLKNTEKLE